MNIIVLAGGYSNERDVSLSSGGSICRALRERGHNAYLLDAFLGLEDAPENLEDVFTLPGGGLEIAPASSVRAGLDASGIPARGLPQLPAPRAGAVQSGRHHLPGPSRRTG